MARIYTLVNQKGGVGKTTTAINMGAYLGYYGQRVLLVDLDPQANATSCLGVEKRSVKSGTYEVLIGAAPLGAQILHNPRFKLSLLPSSPALAGAEVELVDMAKRETRLKEALEPAKERYDYILIDCPPSLDLLTTNALVAASDLLIPVDGGAFGMEALNDTLDAVQSVRQSLRYDLSILGLLLCNVNMRTTFDQAAEETLRERFGSLVFRTMIPNSIRVDEASQMGRPLVFYDPSSPLSHAYRNLVTEIVERGAAHGDQE